MKNNIITIILIVIVAMVAFWYLSQPNNSSDNMVVDTGTVQTGDATYIYNMLQQMSQVTLDDKIFSSDSFKSLKDNTVTFLPQQSGRNNPFAPVGSDFGSSVSTTTLPR